MMEQNEEAARQIQNSELGDTRPGFHLYENERRLIRRIRHLFLLCCIAGLSALLSILSSCHLKGA